MVLVRLIAWTLAAAVTAGCATTGARPKPFPGAGSTPAGAPTPAPSPPTTVATPESPAPSSPAIPAEWDPRRVVETALGFRGVPYRNGGSDPSGFDCSGLVQYAFAQHDIALPREVREQFHAGEEVRLSAVEPGDLLFFKTAGETATHVGIAIGGDQFVHAPSTHGVVRVERFSAPYWANRIVGVRRVGREKTKS